MLTPAGIASGLLGAPRAAWVVQEAPSNLIYNAGRDEWDSTKVYPHRWIMAQVILVKEKKNPGGQVWESRTSRMKQPPPAQSRVDTATGARHSPRMKQPPPPAQSTADSWDQEGLLTLPLQGEPQHVY